jgi:SAM-dependent methyltransferase
MLEGYTFSRAWTRPALVRLIARDVLPLVNRPDAVILELGAGAGELFALMHAAAADAGTPLAGFAWRESDKVPEFLSQPRKYQPTETLVTALPGLTEVPDASVSHVIGLSVFPVIAVRDIQPSLAGIARVLRPGGTFIHVDDLGLSYEAEAHAASLENLVPVPYFEGDTQEALTRPMRVAYVKRPSLEFALRAGGVATSASREELAMWYMLLRDPIALIQGLRLTELYGLKRSLERIRVLDASRDVVMHELTLGRLSEAARAAGLEVVTARETTAEVEADRSGLTEAPPDVAIVRRRYAAQVYGAGVKTPTVRVSSTVALFVARKRG